MPNALPTSHISDADRLDLFNEWFARIGCTSFASKTRAAEKWLFDGIDGLPAAPAARIVSAMMMAGGAR